MSHNGGITSELSIAAAKIRQITRQWALGYHLAVGAVVVKELLGGSFPRSGQTMPSLSQLAALPGMPKRVVLWRAMRAYELSVRLPELLEMQHVSISHVRHVLTLPLAHQREILLQAEREHWNELRVRRAVAGLRPAAKKQLASALSGSPLCNKLARAKSRLQLLQTEVLRADSRDIGRILGLVRESRTLVPGC